jgi:hypothetical protein
MISLLKDILLFLMIGFTMLMLVTTISFFFIKIPSVPSSRRLLNLVFDQIEFSPNATFIDVGSGGGRVVFKAAKHGLQSHGYEISMLPYLWSLGAKLALQSKAQLHFANFFKADLRHAKYIYCYLFPETVLEVWEKIRRENPPGTYLITNTFNLKSEKPIKTLYDHKQKPKIYIYQT